jgi:radical SAM/Cys-rich protein
MILHETYTPPFSQKLKEADLGPLRSESIEVLQINVGLRCNFLCTHCHVRAGQHRHELMSRTIFEKCLNIAAFPDISTVDITGGAPEMNPELSWFIPQAAALKKRFIVRSNCAILLDPDYSHFIDLYAENGIEIMAALPCYLPENTEKQRGAGSYGKIISAIKLLNEIGYGKEHSGLTLNLVHNPTGTSLPPSQQALEQDYKTRLMADHGIRFNKLFCLANNPIGRFLEHLLSSGKYREYMHMLSTAFNPAAANRVMCRTMLSVGWDGFLYDCDFNQALAIPVNHGAPNHISAFDMNKLAKRDIATGDHCYACSAGQGSSCQGVLQKRGE